MLYYRLVLFSILCYTYIFFPLYASNRSSSTPISVLGQNSAAPQVAIDRFGNAIAVWHQFNGHHLVIHASIKPFDGNWQSVSNPLSLPGQNASSPQIAIDAMGNATVVWICFEDSYQIIQASTKLFGGNWQTIPSNLSLPFQNASSPQITVDSFGNITAVWEQSHGTYQIIQASTKLFGGNWQTIPSNLSLPFQNASSPQIAVDSFGNITVVWEQYNGFYQVIQASTKPFSSNWQQPDNLSLINQDASSPKIVVDAEGNATVVWHQKQKKMGIICASTKPHKGNWQLIPDTLSASDYNAFSPQIAVDAEGNAIAIWERYDKWGVIIQSSTKSLNGNWQSRPDTLSHPSFWICEPQIAIDSKGNRLIIFQYRSREFDHLIQLKVKFNKKNEKQRQHQDGISLLSMRGQNAFSPQIACDSFGNAIAVWYQFCGNESIIHASFITHFEQK